MKKFNYIFKSSLNWLSLTLTASFEPKVRTAASLLNLTLSIKLLFELKDDINVPTNESPAPISFFFVSLDGVYSSKQY